MKTIVKIFLTISFFVYSCRHSVVDNELNISKKSFKSEYSKDIHNHFPENNNMFRIIHAMFCRPDSILHYGESFLTLKVSHSKIMELENNNMFSAKLVDRDSVFFISHELIQCCEKIDTTIYYDKCIPIANLGTVNYKIGELPDSVYIEVFNGYRPISKYVLPDDIKTYVIDHAAGNYWISKNNNESRCDKIGKWKNGYSYGYSISEEQGYVTYWAVAW